MAPTEMTPDEIKAWRREHGYTQQALADILGVPKVTVYRWECSGTAARKAPPFLRLTLECIRKKRARKEVKKMDTMDFVDLVHRIQASDDPEADRLLYDGLKGWLQSQDIASVSVRESAAELLDAISDNQVERQIVCEKIRTGCNLGYIARKLRPHLKRFVPA